MAFPNATKLSEFPLKSSFSYSLSLNLPHHCSLTRSLSHSKSSFRTLTFSSLRTTNRSSPKPNPSAPWLPKSPSPKTVTDDQPVHRKTDKAQDSVERIVLRLRNLGLTSEEEEEQEQEEIEVNNVLPPVTGEERLGELLKREWVRPDSMLLDDDAEEDEDEMMLPWERERGKEEEKGFPVGKGEEGLKKRRVTAPSLAELTLEDELLRRLRREGMRVRERVSVPKAGLTPDVMDKIHERWRKEELVRLKFHEELARDMKKAHDIVEVQFFRFPFFRECITEPTAIAKHLNELKLSRVGFRGN